MVYPTVTSCGLGNNLITVAKAHLISESCQMEYQTPVWPPNQHVWPQTRDGYGYYFPTGLSDRVRISVFSYGRRIQQKLSIPFLLPFIYFRREDYQRIGIPDVGEACLKHLEGLGLDKPNKSAVVTTTGMWGDYAAIKRARPWLTDLIMSHGETRERFEKIQEQSRGKLRVGVNIKLGSYAARNGCFQEGERIVRLPLEWYTRICRQIREESDCAFILVTDGTAEELKPFLDEIQPIHYLGQPYTDLLGLQLLIHSDLIICSNSTYSRLAFFLNDKPYVWIADTLVKDESGRYGYLWHDRRNPIRDSLAEDTEAVRRCFAISNATTSLPTGLKRYVGSAGTQPIEIWDDLIYRDPIFLM
jgi:hypothetical protein